MRVSKRPLPMLRVGVVCGLLYSLLVALSFATPAAALQEKAEEAPAGEASGEVSSETEAQAESMAESQAGGPAESSLVPLYVPSDVEAPERPAVDSDASAPQADDSASSASASPESSASSESPEPVASESTGLVPLFQPTAAPETPARTPELRAQTLDTSTPDTSTSQRAPASSAPVPLFEPDSADSGGWSELGSQDGAADAGWDDSVPLYQPEEDPWAGEPWDEPLDEGSNPEGDWPEDDVSTGGAPALDLEQARRLIASEMSSPGGVVPAEVALDVVTPGDLDDDLGDSALRGRNELGLDLRSVERFRWQCSNALGRRDVTLFANGTVRLRRGRIDRQEMQLDELDTETLLSYLSRLSRIQRSRELRHDVAGGENFGQVHGELGENCRLSLRLPNLPPVVLTMPRLEVPQLGIAQLVAIADELAEFTRPLDRPRQVRADYEPQPGDRLRRKDGRYFRVIGPTSDGGGVELEGLQEPVRIFYRLVDLPLLFEPAGEPDAAHTEPVDASEPDVREIVDIGGGF